MKLSIITILSFLIFIGCTNHKPEVFKPYKHTSIPKGWSEKTISYNDFVKKYKKELKYENIIRRGKVGKELKRDIMSKVWQDLLNRSVINNEITYLGISIPQTEVKDFLTGRFIADDVKNNTIFQDPKTGNVSKQKISQFINKVKNSKDENLTTTWNHFTNKIKKERLYSKYEDLIKNGIQYTPQLGIWYSKFINKESTVDVIALPYRTLHDSVKVTDKDYKTYLDSNKVFYTMQEQRNVNLIKVPIKIHKHFHKQEFTKFKNYIAKNKFANVPIKYKEVLQFNSYYKESTVPKTYKTFFDTAKVGSVSVPTFYDNSFRAIRLDSIKKNVPLKAKAEHFVMVDISYKQAQLILNKVKTRIKKGEKFADIAKEYENKMGDKCLYGETNWFLETDMVKPFSDACFFNKPGSIIAAKSRYGWHIIHVLKHKYPETRYFYSALYYPLKPTKKDKDAAITEASNFVKTLKNKKYYDQELAANRYIKRVRQLLISHYLIDRMPGTESQLKWAFKAHLYDFSKPFISNNKVYFIQVTRIVPPGVLPVDIAKDFYRATVLNLKVKKYLKQKYNFNKLNKLDRETVSKKLNMQPITIKNVMVTKKTIPQFGSDNYLAGLINSFKVGEESKLIFGKRGLYRFKKTNEVKIKINNYLKIVQTRLLSKIDNKTYIKLLLFFNKLIVNQQRDQDSYYLIENYNDKLKFDSVASKEMFSAEALFHQKRFKEALYGINNIKGFDKFVKNKPSKQTRLAKYYAAVCAYKLKKYDDVLMYLKNVKFKDRFISVISKGLCGDAYIMKGNKNKALEYYRKAEQAKLNFMITPLYLLKMAAIYDSLKDYKHARNILKEIKTKYKMGQMSFNMDSYIAYYDYKLQPDKVLYKKN